jgi:uncharacterized protein (TIGR02145 family)
MKMKNRISICLLMGLVLTLSSSCTKDNDNIDIPKTVTDIDGNVYHTVTIGSQTWMAENLKVTRYRDSSSIPNVTIDSVWTGLSTGAYCWSNNNIYLGNTYGALYNWYAVNNTKGLCPTGWHVPSEDEWTTLTDYLGGAAGGKLKETGTTHWNYPNGSATNESGFTALPGGGRGEFFGDVGRYGDWWSSSESSTAGYAWFWTLDYGTGNVLIFCGPKFRGCSVRCVMD